jgi:flagellar protein FliL
MAMKLLLPVVLGLGGLAGGAGLALALKPAPDPLADAAACAEDPDCERVAALAPVAPARGAVETVPLDKPFVVPVFENGRPAGMVVIGLALEVGRGQASHVLTLQPRLRDAFLGVMFRHANSGGFDGSFTEGQKMADLKAALLGSAEEVMTGIPVAEVLVTEIVRQDR